MDPSTIESFPELEMWKENIETLVKDFHQQATVHGDLRLANFIFTESKNLGRILLVDFDRGGEVRGISQRVAEETTRKNEKQMAFP